MKSLPAMAYGSVQRTLVAWGGVERLPPGGGKAWSWGSMCGAVGRWRTEIVDARRKGKPSPSRGRIRLMGCCIAWAIPQVATSSPQRASRLAAFWDSIVPRPAQRWGGLVVEIFRER